MSSTRSPIADAIALIAEAQIRTRPLHGAVVPQVLSYHEDFSFLWSLDHEATGGISGGALGRDFLARLTAPTPDCPPLILVWGSSPSQGSDYAEINVTDWTTPYDWLIAVGSRLRRYRLPAALRVVLIDACSHRHPSSFAVQFFQTFRPGFRWLRVVRLGPGSGRTNDSKSSMPEALPWVAEVVEALGSDRDSQLTRVDALDRGAEAALQLVQRIWKQAALSPTHRHAVSNLIGPSILSSHLQRSGWSQAETVSLPQTLPLRAFRHLLDEIFSEDVLPAITDSGSYGATRTSPLATSRILRDRFGAFGRGVRFRLVDDHTRVGFHEVVRCLLGIAQVSSPEVGDRRGAHELRSDDSPSRLVAWLHGQLQSSTSKTGRLPHTCVHCGASTAALQLGRPQAIECSTDLCDVLILDLRLFAESRQSEEIAFLRELLAYYHLSGLCLGGDDLDYRLVSAAAIAAEAANQRLQRLLADDAGPPKGRTSQHYSGLSHLALLPLLLHHADPALPIVVFSSTQQRQVLELLQCSGVIITTCRKPSITGYEDTWSLDDACFSFLDAIDTALRLLELRVVWDEGKQTRLGSPPKCHVRDWNVGPANGLGAPVGYKPQSWRMNPPRFRAMLERWYRDYALVGRWHDFMSVPWEFVEGSLIHPHYIEEPNPGISGFGVDASERGSLARALEFCRHRKAHGYALAGAVAAPDDDQAAGLCMWLIALDFVSGVARTHTDESHQGAVRAFGDLTTLLAHRHPVIQEGLETGRITWPTGAQDLVALGVVSTPEFVLSAIAEAMSCKGRRANAWVRRETLMAVAAVIDGLADDQPGKTLEVRGQPTNVDGEWRVRSKLGMYSLTGGEAPSSGTAERRYTGAWSSQQRAWAAT